MNRCVIPNHNNSKLRSRKLGLGTVQWGMCYGIANSDGQTSPQEVERILTIARASGITLLDTAAMYGDAEAQLGRHPLTGFQVVTKLPSCQRSSITHLDIKHLMANFRLSLQRLNQASIYGLLVHHAEDLIASGGEYIIDAIQELKEDGYVNRIGISVYEKKHISAILQRFTPDIIQLPINVLDQRLLEDGTLEQLQSMSIEVHARSALLQGLLIMPLNTIPIYFEPWFEQLRHWRDICLSEGTTPLHAALAFVCDLKAVSYCLLGVENHHQLKQCLVGLNEARPIDATELACNDTNLLNPSSWKLT